MQTQTDSDLIAAYARSSDQRAFAELVLRHQRMVYRVCQRMLGQHQEAEDATQAVFLVMLHKANGLTRKGELTGWLYGVARNVALEALRKRARRQEEAMLDETETVAAEDSPDHEAALQSLDRELAGLSGVLRQAVVLRYLQGYDQAEAARQAGCSMGTLASRASRGIERLRQRLAKRGVALGGVALASLLTSEASAAIPETLLPSILATVKTAVATTATATGATSTAVMLAKGAMKAMYIAQVKMVAAVAAAVVVTGTAVPVGIAVAQAVGKEAKLAAAEDGGRTTAMAVAQAKETLAWVENDKSNLRQLGAACLIYASDHNGQFPADWSQLVPNYVDRPSNLLVTAKNRQHAGAFTNVMQWTDYLYVKGHTVRSPGRAILAYLPPAFYPMKSEALVLFANCSVGELTADAFTNALQHPLAAELTAQKLAEDTSNQVLASSYTAQALAATNSTNRTNLFKQALAALATYRQYLKEPGQIAEADMELANIQLAMGEKRKATATYQRVFDMQPVDLHTIACIEGAGFNLVSLLLDAKRLDSVLETIDLYLKMYPKGRHSSDMRELRSQLPRDMGNLADETAVLSAGTASVRSATAAAAVAGKEAAALSAGKPNVIAPEETLAPATVAARLKVDAFASQKKFDPAEAELAKIPSNTDEYMSARLLISDRYYQYGNLSKAREGYDEVLDAYAKNGPPPELRRFYMDSAYKYSQMLLNRNDARGAVKAMRYILVAKPESYTRRMVEVEMAEMLLKIAETLPVGEERKATIKEAYDLCVDVMWEQDILFGRAVVVLAHCKKLSENSAAARKLVMEKLPMLREMEKTIEDSVRHANPSVPPEKLKELIRAALRESPMAHCNYLLGTLYEDDGRALLAAGKAPEAKEQIGMALAQFVTVVQRYPASSRGPEACQHIEALITLGKERGWGIDIPPDVNLSVVRKDAKAQAEK